MSEPELKKHSFGSEGDVLNLLAFLHDLPVGENIRIPVLDYPGNAQLLEMMKTLYYGKHPDRLVVALGAEETELGLFLIATVVSTTQIEENTKKTEKRPPPHRGFFANDL